MICSHMIFSKTLETWGLATHCLLPDLWMATVLAAFHCEGKRPSKLALLKKYAKEPQRALAQDLSTKPDRLSSPVALETLSLSFLRTSDLLMVMGGIASKFA